VKPGLDVNLLLVDLDFGGATVALDAEAS